MTVLQGIVLGIVQGLTEFLPVSSSGHLVLANYFLGWGESLSLTVEIATNTGTFLAVIIALRKDVWEALSGFLAGLGSREGRRREGWRLALLVLAGSVPTALIGLALRGVFERLSTPLPVALALAVTGLILWFTPRGGAKERPGQLSFRDAVIGGLAQGLAVVPGVSRSGTTIATMLWRGASARLAPTFSFLLYLVASLGATLVGLDEVRAEPIDVAPLIAMVAASFATGYLALQWLFALLRRGQFRMFAPYLWALSLVTLISLALR